MNDFRFSTFLLKLIGFSGEEAKLVLQRDNQYNNKGVVLSEHKVESDLRYAGLTDADRALAESNSSSSEINRSNAYSSLRYEGLSGMDSAHAKSFDKEFGHLTNPWERKFR